MNITTAKKITKVTTNVFALLMGVMIVGTNIAFSNSAAINTFLHAKTQEIIPAEDGDSVDKEYYKSVFNSVKEVKANGEKLNKEIVAEGSVLLKNDKALPLNKGAKVSLFSTSSVDLVYAGTGSSGTNTNGAFTLKEGLEENGKLSVNETLWNWYKDNLSVYGRGGSNGGAVGASFGVGDAKWDEIGTSAKKDKAEAAIFVLSRKGGEGADLTISGGNPDDLTNGNYLELSPSEIDVLKHLKEEKDKGTFQKIVVLMNSANQVQCDFVDDAAYGIDAMLWCGDLGAMGVYSVGDLLVGERTPSGKLSDTFWKEHYLNPVYANWGDCTYTGKVVGTSAPNTHNNKYVAYQEGIYNGYRYTETRYEDVVLGRANAGSFDYSAAVSYPFGYGLSYSEFSYSDYEVSYSEEKDAYTVSVKVTNDGSVKGKEVAEVYLQKPYTDYDVKNGVEKAAVELVGFAKTKELAPTESETLTIEVEKKYFASYDSYGAQTYIVDAGDYYLTVASDAHKAVNNILSAKGKTTKDGMTENGDSSLVQKFNESAFDDETYSVAVTGKEIVNQFDCADLNRYENRGNNSIIYVTRNNWTGTVKLGYDEKYQPLNNFVVIEGNDNMTKDQSPVPQPDDGAYPAYGSTETAYSLIDLRAYEDGTPIEYDNEMWEDFLNQMTWNDQIELLLRGLRMTYSVPSIGKPQTIDHNGATGPVQPYNDNPSVNNGLAIRKNDPDASEKPTLYPSNGLVASTFNQPLVLEYGRAWGEDCLWAGYAGIYGPGLNIHRGAYGGRSFEYFSEDSILTGKMVSLIAQGLREKGTYAYLKHCVLNDQEKNRESMSTWANEQTIREVYLRAFQIGIEDVRDVCVMTSFNRLGCIWSGNQGFINTVLHGEFGMTGFAVTDWFMTFYGNGYMTMPYAILMGQDIPDGDALTAQYGGMIPADNYLEPYKEGYSAVGWAMRESSHRILYTVVHSNAMNGMSAGTRIVRITPTWQIALNAVYITSIVLTCVSAVAFIACTILEKKAK